jgi:hypothetical protein
MNNSNALSPLRENYSNDDTKGKKRKAEDAVENDDNEEKETVDRDGEKKTRAKKMERERKKTKKDSSKKRNKKRKDQATSEPDNNKKAIAPVSAGISESENIPPDYAEVTKAFATPDFGFFTRPRRATTTTSLQYKIDEEEYENPYMNTRSRKKVGYIARST